MSLHDRIESLKAKHAALDDALAMEAKRPLPDGKRIADLKREKLRLKDELTKASRH